MLDLGHAEPNRGLPQPPNSDRLWLAGFLIGFFSGVAVTVTIVVVRLMTIV